VPKERTSDTIARRESPTDPAESGSHRRHHWWRWAAAAVAVGAALAVAVPYAYIHFVQGTPPDKLSLGSVDAKIVSSPVSLDGRWRVASGSTAGYRIDEVLLGQRTTAVGRTHDVTGTFTLHRSTVSNGSFTVDLATVTSVHGLHDSAFRRLLDTQDRPTSTFVMTAPIELGSIPATGRIVNVIAAGNLTLNGTTKPVEFPLEVRRIGGRVDVLGALQIRFEDYGIENPTNAAATVGDVGTIEFLLRFEKAADIATTTTTTPAPTSPTTSVPIQEIPQIVSTTEPRLGF
jgi:polyisoprenoid-binding protein YceI